jgi:hypothetical protein
MTLKNKNPWKLLSIGLLGVIAIGLLTPIDAAKPEPKPDSNQAILDLLLDSIFGLEAIHDDVAAVQSSSYDIIDALTYVDVSFECVVDFEGPADGICTNVCDEHGNDRALEVIEYDYAPLVETPDQNSNKLEFYYTSTEPTTFTILCLRT